MQINCHLQDPELDPDDLFKLTHDFKLAIAEETDIQADLPVGAPALGSRGDPITVGALALTFISSGAAVALIRVLQTYVARRPSLEVELSRPDGSKLSIKAQDLNPTMLTETQQTAQKFFDA